MTIFPRILELLREAGADDIVLFGGGVMPLADVRTLKQMGVAELFVSDTPTEETVAWIRHTAERQRAAVA
jgi:methylmalonyl-CoA mutase C-terminal domain/subunit